MKVNFDDQAWLRLQDNLQAGQVCGETAGRLFTYAKSAMQQSAAAMIGHGDATSEQAVHTLEMLRAMRNATEDAAQRFAEAVASIDSMAQQFGVQSAKSRRKVQASVRER